MYAPATLLTTSVGGGGVHKKAEALAFLLLPGMENGAILALCELHGALLGGAGAEHCLEGDWVGHAAPPKVDALMAGVCVDHSPAAPDAEMPVQANALPPCT